MEAFSSLDTIKKETGCAFQTIRKSILALEKEGAIKVKRKCNAPNVYTFTKLEEDFERYTFEFLDKVQNLPHTKEMKLLDYKEL